MTTVSRVVWCALAGLTLLLLFAVLIVLAFVGVTFTTWVNLAIFAASAIYLAVTFKIVWRRND